MRDDLLVVPVSGRGRPPPPPEALNRIKLLVPRGPSARRQTRTILHDDLIGLEAVTLTGETLGRVTAVLNHGAGDILEIAAEGGATFLLPFTKAVAVEIDFAARRIVVAPPREVRGEAE